MKKNHKNDKRRITAEERVATYFSLTDDYGDYRNYLVKMLGDHVKAARRRHARKNICVPRTR